MSVSILHALLLTNKPPEVARHLPPVILDPDLPPGSRWNLAPSPVFNLPSSPSSRAGSPPQPRSNPATHSTGYPFLRFPICISRRALLLTTLSGNDLGPQRRRHRPARIKPRRPPRNDSKRVCNRTSVRNRVRVLHSFCQRSLSQTKPSFQGKSNNPAAVSLLIL